MKFHRTAAIEGAAHGLLILLLIPVGAGAEVIAAAVTASVCTAALLQAVFFPGLYVREGVEALKEAGLDDPLNDGLMHKYRRVAIPRWVAASLASWLWLAWALQRAYG